MLHCKLQYSPENDIVMGPGEKIIKVEKVVDLLQLFQYFKYWIVLDHLKINLFQVSVFSVLSHPPTSIYQIY